MVFYNYANYDLNRLKGETSGLKINFSQLHNRYYQNVFEILENFQLDKPVEKLIKNYRLYLLIDKLHENLHLNVVDNHMMRNY